LVAGKDQKKNIDILEAMHYTVQPVGKERSRPSNIVSEKLATAVDNPQMLMMSQ
jgi:hypothetical protein